MYLFLHKNHSLKYLYTISEFQYETTVTISTVHKISKTIAT